jgi:hypothetical protein
MQPKTVCRHDFFRLLGLGEFSTIHVAQLAQLAHPKNLAQVENVLKIMHKNVERIWLLCCMLRHE